MLWWVEVSRRFPQRVGCCSGGKSPADLADFRRGWGGVVVGESLRQISRIFSEVGCCSR